VQEREIRKAIAGIVKYESNVEISTGGRPFIWISAPHNRYVEGLTWEEALKKLQELVVQLDSMQKVEAQPA